ARVAARKRGGTGHRIRRLLTARLPGYVLPGHTGERPGMVTRELRDVLQASREFDRVNSAAVRLTLGTVNLVTGAETYFDNDRHVLSPEHVLASTALPGLPPITIDGQSCGNAAVSVTALDDARPADTLCFVIDGYDPVPGRGGG